MTRMSVFEILTRSQQLRALTARVEALEADKVARDRRREQTRAAREASPANKPRVDRQLELEDEEQPPRPISGLGIGAFKRIQGGQS